MPALSLDGTILIPRLMIADTFLSRAVGLMGKPEFAVGDGLLIRPCRSIHTCFMRFSIDTLFLDKQNRVVKVVRDLRPWRMAHAEATVQSVVEVKSGWLSPTVEVGSQLEILFDSP